MSDSISRSFSLNFAVMRFAGLYPSEEHSSFYRLYSVIVFFVAMLPIFMLGVLRFVLAENVTVANYNDFALFGIMIYTFKLLPFVKNGTRMRACSRYFGAARYAAAGPEHRKIVEDCVAACRRNSRVYFAGCAAAVSVFNVQIFLAGDFAALPLNVWLPNVFRKFPSIFFCVYFTLILGIVYAALASGVVDPLIGGLCHHASAQLRILKHRLQVLDCCRHDKPSRLVSDSYVIYRKIIECIRLYQDIVNFVSEYEECFSLVVFSQFTGSALVIGMCCFQLSAASGGVTVVFNVMCLSLLFFQIFFYCYYGALLIEENNSLVTAIYMSRWYEYNEQSKRALLILMERSKKPLIVTAGKVLDLSLETFTLILRRSYSLVAVLKNF